MAPSTMITALATQCFLIRPVTREVRLVNSALVTVLMGFQHATTQHTHLLANHSLLEIGIASDIHP